MKNYSNTGFGTKYFKIVKTALAVIFGLFALLVIISLFMSSKYEVERSIAINADYNKIESLIASPKRWTEWSVWNYSIDSTVVFNFEGPESGKGATMNFKGDLIGDGKMIITDYNQNVIDYRMTFADGAFVTNGTILIQTRQASVNVIWKITGDVGWNPFAKYFRSLLKNLLAEDIDKDLMNLKKAAENAPKI